MNIFKNIYLYKKIVCPNLLLVLYFGDPDAKFQSHRFFFITLKVDLKISPLLESPFSKILFFLSIYF